MGVASAIGSAFTKLANGITGGVIDKAIDLVDKLVPDRDLAQNLKAQLETLRLTQLHEIDLARIELEKVHETSESAIVIAQQATFQAEVNQSDLYTKQTRPKIARRSFNISALYGMLCFLSDFVVRMVQTFSHPSDKATIEWLNSLQGVQFHWEVFIAIASPALTYMGVRSFDVWRAGGAKQV